VTDYEKLGVFYLGREYDLAAKTTGETPLLYDSRDLVTHAAIIGMTGSGKTGLAITLLEESGIDGIPAIAIDPKGDLGNLLLGFPALSPEAFLPWVNPDEAARQHLSVEAFAAQQATTWRDGLAAWGQDGARIVRLREAVDLAIYTPGSSAGLGLSILRSFAAPPPEVRDDAELFAERVGTTVTGLLTLLGLDADPVRSRDHVLLSTIVGAAWRAGEDLDLAGLIGRVQSPPVPRVGVLDLESFYPATERFALAMRVNALLAAPSFAAWSAGEPLDVGALLYTPAGTPRISVVSIAHLAEAERMFIVSLLLNEVVAWVRKQPGTTSLRALLYMDEVMGYVPPVANPPSKIGFMTLLKQARAFGLGVVLATQNPGDLDYKALGNLGTWMIGRLQTDRDRGKVLDALEGALGATGRFDRARADAAIASLGKRVFLLNNIHEDAAVAFETRWALSYLRGPLTRDQIKALMQARVAHAAGGAAAPAAARAGSGTTGGATAADRQGTDLVAAGATSAAAAARPVLPPEVPQVFVPRRGGGDAPAYEPQVFAAGQVQFVDPKLGVNEVAEVAVLVPFVDAPVPVDFERARPSEHGLTELDTDPEPGARFGSVPPAAARARSYPAWEKSFAGWLYRTQALSLMRDAATGLTSRPGETEREFRIRVQLADRERRDAEKARLEQKFAPKMAALDERIRKAQERVAREADQAQTRKMETAISVGSSLLGALFGRRALTATTMGRVASAARSATRTVKEAKDVGLAEENVGALQQQRADLDATLAAEVAALETQAAATTRGWTRVEVRPRKTNIAVQKVALAWVPAGSRAPSA
jgi:hypothetical protein